MKKFPHTVFIDLMEAVQSRNFNVAYEKIYQLLIGNYHEIITKQMTTPELRPVLLHMLEHFKDKEEYEKCEVLKRLLN